MEHPEWFLRRTDGEPDDGENLLLDLGCPEAWQWAVDTVSTLIDENGIDCYPLTACILDPVAWSAYQLHVPERGEGAVLAFRREESPIKSMVFQLRDLRGQSYTLEDVDTGESRDVSGTALAVDGLSISLNSPRSSKLIFYRECRDGSSSTSPARSTSHE